MLPIPDKGSTIYDCLDKFTSSDLLTGDNKYYDSNTKTKIDAYRQCIFDTKIFNYFVKKI